jgi:hypothetical protein
MRDYCFFNAIYIVVEIPETLKPRIVKPIYMKGCQQWVENYSEINTLYKV